MFYDYEQISSVAGDRLSLNGVELTEQQSKIAVRVAEGSTNEQIAEEFDCSVGNTNNYLRNICNKTGLRTRYQISAGVAREHSNIISINHSEDYDLSFNAFVQKLTPQQQRVLPYLMNGEPTCIISKHLNIEEATVKYHLIQISKRLGIESRVGVIVTMSTLCERLCDFEKNSVGVKGDLRGYRRPDFEPWCAGDGRAGDEIIARADGVSFDRPEV